MSTPLQPLITKAGLAAIWNATKTGVSAEITHIGLGSAGYKPSDEQKALRTQEGKYPIAGGEQLSSTLIHLTAIADDGKAFWVREIGFFLSDGTLLAVWSDADTPLTYKAGKDEVLLAYDLSLQALPADSVTINSTAAGLNLTLAAPLAAQAAAMIAVELRNLKQHDEIEQQAETLRIAGEKVSLLLSRIADVEARQAADRDGLLTAAASNAAGLIALQKILVQHLHGA